MPLRGRSLAQLSVDDLLKQARPWCGAAPPANLSFADRSSLAPSRCRADYAEKMRDSLWRQRGRPAPSVSDSLTFAAAGRRREFFGGSTPAREFSIPRSKPEVIYKLSENIYEFIGNYLLIALFCVVCVLCASRPAPHVVPRFLWPALPSAESADRAAAPRRSRSYKRPLALLGIFIASKAWDWLRKHQQARGLGRESVCRLRWPLVLGLTPPEREPPPLQEEGGAREPPSDPGAQPGGAGGAGPGAGTGGGGAGAGGGRAQQQGLQPARSRRRELAHWAVTGCASAPPPASPCCCAGPRARSPT